MNRMSAGMHSSGAEMVMNAFQKPLNSLREKPTAENNGVMQCMIGVLPESSLGFSDAWTGPASEL